MPAPSPSWFGVAGRAAVPFETQANVCLVTGYTTEAWTARQMPQMTSPPKPAAVSRTT
jgi:hypothetical protein